MTNYLNQTRRQSEGKSGGNTGLNVLIFIGGAVAILVLVILIERGERMNVAEAHRAAALDNTPTETTASDNTSTGTVRTGKTAPRNTTKTGGADDPYTKRGFQPNYSTPKTGTDNQTTGKTAGHEEPKFIGDADWKRYHRPDCKYAKFIDNDKKVPFGSAAEAFAKGYIPCKVCKPEVPSDMEAPTPANPVQPPDKEKSISAPVKDVNVPFPFKVVDRAPDNEKGVIQIDLQVDLQNPLKKQEDILLLAQKLVAQETARQPVNAVSMTLRCEMKGPSVQKWICMVDWAPYGVLTRANEVKTGDYRTHKFYIYMMGFYKR